MIDSYEKFIDEYVTFMKNLKEDPTDMELLQEYSVYLERYSEVMEKINAVDADKLSAADYIYYSQFMIRMYEKIKEAE